MVNGILKKSFFFSSPSSVRVEKVTPLIVFKMNVLFSAAYKDEMVIPYQKINIHHPNKERESTDSEAGYIRVWEQVRQT